MTRHFAAVLALAAAASLASCSSSDESSGSGVSAACEGALRKMADNYTAANYESLVGRSLDLCSTKEEWLSGVTANPASMGLASGAAVQEVDWQAACAGHPAAAACS